MGLGLREGSATAGRVPISWGTICQRRGMNMNQARAHSNFCKGRQSPPGSKLATYESGFLSALWASIQTPDSGKGMGYVKICHSQLCQVTRQLKEIDEKFHHFRELFHQDDGTLSGPVEVKLADLLQAVSFFLSKHPALNGRDIQLATASLITSVDDLNSQVKGTENKKRYSEIFRSLDALEISVGNAAIDMFTDEANDNTDISNLQAEKLQIDEGLFKHEIILEDKKPGSLSVEEADEMLIKCDGGVEAALDYAKMWCKYVKELLSWIDKRLAFEVEFAKNILKIADAGRSAIYLQNCMPLQTLYTMIMEYDIKAGNLAIETAGTLHLKEYYEPLWAKKNEIEKWRKEFRDQWQKEQKRMNDALSSMRKSRLHYLQRCEDLEKAKVLSAKAEEEFQATAGSGNKQLEKRRRYRDEVQIKVYESAIAYRACVSDANSRRQELQKTRERIISHVRKLVFQGDEVLTRVTLRMFKLQQAQAERIPVGYQNLTEFCKPYRVGEKYMEFIQNMQKRELPMEVYRFEEFMPSGQRSPTTGRRKNVLYSHISSTTLDHISSSEEVSGKPSSSSNEQSANKSFNSDTESLGGSTEGQSWDSPISSPDLTDSASEYVLSQLKNINPSNAAQTHRLRKLRGPSKCRECDNFMVSGLECEECLLACHKKCLESLLINCGHQKLPARVSLFGTDFTQVPRDFPEEVPFLVVKCTSEIESRALGVQGIYRISGAKARMEKLCQAFENGRSLVELSDHSPHDITGVLKQFLKALTSPVIPFELYDDFLALSRSLRKPEDGVGDNSEALGDLIRRSKDLLSKLPASNYNTLRHLIAHLYRVAERYEENLMSPNNLGIVFGPTLIHSPFSNDVSMSCLVDSGYQSQLIEFFILNYERIFGMEDLPLSGICECDNSLKEANTEETLSNNEKDLDLPSENSSSKLLVDENDSIAEDISSTDARQSMEQAHCPVSRDSVELDSSDAAPDSDTIVSTQSRGRFSRMPVKYPRNIIPKVSSLPLLAATLSNPEAISGLLEQGASSRSNSPDTRGKHKHFEMTPQTARIVSKFQSHSKHQDDYQDEQGATMQGKPLAALGKSSTE